MNEGFLVGVHEMAFPSELEALLGLKRIISGMDESKPPEKRFQLDSLLGAKPEVLESGAMLLEFGSDVAIIERRHAEEFSVFLCVGCYFASREEAEACVQEGYNSGVDRELRVFEKKISPSQGQLKQSLYPSIGVISEPPPVVHRFANGELGAVPALESIVRCPPGALRETFDQMFDLVAREKLFPTGSNRESLISCDGQVTFYGKRLTEESIRKMYEEAVAAMQRSDSRSTTMLFVGRTDVEHTPAFTNILRITVGRSNATNDWPVVSLYVSSTRLLAWEILAGLRDSVQSTTGDHFCWSSLGYGFVCDLDRFFDAGSQMEALCMRYLGVDLQDPFGTYAFTEANGLRSVNWQVCMAPGWMKSVNPEAAESIAASGTAHGEHLLWQTGEAPSLCDRNSVADHEAIRRYRALDSQLAPLIFVPELPWFPRWNVGTTERWRKRWGEVGI